MDFRPLYDARRQLFGIGYRLADADGAGRLDASRYDLLASEARLASFLAIGKGDVPESHWFHLGRVVTAVHGAPALLSWTATLFEYLMPLLADAHVPGTLLDQSCRLAIRRHIDYAASAASPGESPSRPTAPSIGTASISTRRSASRGWVSSGDSAMNWSSRRMRRRLRRMLVPAASAKNLRRLAALGLEGDYGFFDAIDYTDRTQAATGGSIADAPIRSSSARTWHITRA